MDSDGSDNSGCGYCGDPDWTPELDDTEDDGQATCRSGGCGLVFGIEDIDPDDLAFGFHIEDPFGLPEDLPEVDYLTAELDAFEGRLRPDLADGQLCGIVYDTDGLPA